MCIIMHIDSDIYILFDELEKDQNNILILFQFIK